MKAQFPAALQQVRTGAGRQDSAQPAGQTAPSAAAPSSQTSGSASPLAEPLRIVVDKAQHRLALLSGNRIVRLYAVGLGGDRTPEGEFEIIEKVRNPNNKSNGDFGSRGMTLSDTQYAIHGTNKPESIGKDESLGCVRMGQQDLEELYDMVPHGTKVTIGKNLLPSDAPLSGQGDDSGKADSDNGKGKPRFRLPLQTNDANPKKIYKWLG
jgi:lipoprotein-anchoring transpeptidase ErfK/SrfK